MKKVISFLPWIGALLLIAIALLCFEADLLWKVQQYNLFLDTSLFFREQMLVSGGFLSYISCYFTQFFYYPWLGVLLLCGWWLLLMWLTKRTFRIADNWATLVLIPIAALLVANMSLGYWHYFIRVRGYFFVPTIGTTAAVAMLWAFRALPQKQWLRIVYIFVATIIGYPLFGIYALAAILLMGIWTWRLSDNKQQNTILTAVALLSLIAVPLIYYRYVYYQTFFNDIWTTALPITNVLRNYFALYIPYYIIIVFYLLLAVLKPLTCKPLYRWGLQGVLVIALIAGVWHWWYKDENFHHELAMQHCIEQSDWEGVVSEGEKQGETEPTRSIILMRNIALFRLGRQCDEMYDFPWGRKVGDPKVPYDMLGVAFCKTIFYHYGLLNDTHRKCMEDGVEYGWTVEALHYLARCSILRNERPAAQKVLNLLRHTMFYGERADSLQQLLGNPQKINRDPELGSVIHMLQYQDALGLDEGKPERYLMNVLAYQDSYNFYFQEQAVLAALHKRNPGLFWPRYNRYRQLRRNSAMPRIFQEAAYLFSMMGKGPNPAQLSIDKGVKDSYAAFVRESKKYDNQQAIIGRTALHPFFGNTYYFYYYFLQDMQ